MIRPVLTRVIAETIEVDGRTYRAELAEPRERWSVVLDHGGRLEVIGHADDEAAAIAQANRLSLQLEEFTVGHETVRLQ